MGQRSGVNAIEFAGFDDLGTNGWKLLMERELRGLDVKVQARVLDRGLNTPPGSPAAGAAYIIGSSPTGAWSGKANNVTRWNDYALEWEFWAPKSGWEMFVVDESEVYRWTGTAWGLVFSDIRKFGAVGDDSTNNDAAFTNAVASGEVVLPEGKFRISTEIPANQRGVPMRGPGSIMVPVDQNQPNKGYHRYPFTEDEGLQWFGMEYLYPLHKAWKDSPTAKPKIYMAGDSTIAGSYITEPYLLPHNALLTGIRQRGFEAEVFNKAVPGNNIANFNAQMSDAEIDAATGIMVSFGINDTFPPPASWTTVVSGVPQTSTPVHASLDAFIDAYRTVLQRIRSRRSELDCAIIIKTSNAVSDTQHSRDETQAYAQRRALRKLARDWKCVLIDIPMYVSDVRPNQLIDGNGTIGPTGKWSGQTPIQPGWMDDPFRTDPNFHDPNAYWCAVHPLEVGNVWIWGIVADVLCLPARYLSHNQWTNNSLTQAGASWAPSVYGIGATTYRAATGDGWPVDGFVHTIKDVTGNGIQWLWSYLDTYPDVRVRVTKPGDAWSEWSTKTEASPNLQNGWVEETSSPVRIIRRNGMVHLTGCVKNGTNTQGTVVMALPAGWAPVTDVYLMAWDYNAGWCVVRVAGTNNQTDQTLVRNVTVHVPSANGYINLSGLSWPTAYEL